jgi:putative transposase
MDNDLQVRELSSLTSTQREQATKRYRLIEPYLKEKATLKSICKKHDLSLRTVSYWVQKYLHYGLAGLARKARADKGHHRLVHPDMQQLIEGIYLKYPHLSFAAIYRRIQKHQNDGQHPIPAYRTVCSILSSLPDDIVTLAHKGNSAYKQQFDLLCRFEAKNPNQIWQADHACLDIWLLNQQNKPQRPWLTIIFDDYSRAIAGFELSFLAPSAMKTALCLRTAIWIKNEPAWTICGIPEILYTDHGSDFTSKHIEQVCIDLKINLIFSQIAEPRGRGKIERFFSVLNQLLVCDLPGYTKDKKTKAILTIAELNELVRKFVIEYNQRTHSQIGCAPKQRWEQNGFLPQMPKSVEQLDLLLLTIKNPRKVMRDGIHFQGLVYMDTILAGYIGESVIIRYDPVDITSIRVFYQGKFLCQPICLALSDQTVSLKEIQAARNTRKHILRQQIKQRLSLVDAILHTKRNAAQAQHSLQSQKPSSKTKLKLYETDN